MVTLTSIHIYVVHYSTYTHVPGSVSILKSRTVVLDYGDLWLSGESNTAVTTRCHRCHHISLIVASASSSRYPHCLTNTSLLSIAAAIKCHLHHQMLPPNWTVESKLRMTQVAGLFSLHL
jgi:hypothetical protein